MPTHIEEKIEHSGEHIAHIRAVLNDLSAVTLQQIAPDYFPDPKGDEANSFAATLEFIKTTPVVAEIHLSKIVDIDLPNPEPLIMTSQHTTIPSFKSFQRILHGDRDVDGLEQQMRADSREIAKQIIARAEEFQFIPDGFGAMLYETGMTSSRVTFLLEQAAIIKHKYFSDIEHSAQLIQETDEETNELFTVENFIEGLDLGSVQIPEIQHEMHNDGADAYITFPIVEGDMLKIHAFHAIGTDDIEPLGDTSQLSQTAFTIEATKAGKPVTALAVNGAPLQFTFTVEGVSPAKTVFWAMSLETTMDFYRKVDHVLSMKQRKNESTENYKRRMVNKMTDLVRDSAGKKTKSETLDILPTPGAYLLFGAGTANYAADKIISGIAREGFVNDPASAPRTPGELIQSILA